MDKNSSRASSSRLRRSALVMRARLLGSAAREASHLAALSPLVTITGTLIGALALAEGATDADTLWAAAMVDEDWQAERWGEDTLAAQTRAAKRRDYDAGVRFLSLL